MLTFTFDIIDNYSQSKLGGLVRGHMTIDGKEGAVTSRGKEPDQSMMIFLSIVELLDGMRHFLSEKNASKYNFVGVDSSFQITAIKGENGCITLMVENRVLDTTSRNEIVRAIWEGVSQFLKRYDHCIKPGDAIRSDLTAAVEGFKREFQLTCGSS